MCNSQDQDFGLRDLLARPDLGDVHSLIIRQTAMYSRIDGWLQGVEFCRICSLDRPTVVPQGNGGAWDGPEHPDESQTYGGPPVANSL